MTMTKATHLISFSLLVLAAAAAPGTQRGSQCQDDSDLWFGSNEVLTYKYTAEVETGLSVTDSANDNEFKFECTVEAHPLPGCQRLLKVPRCVHQDKTNPAQWVDFSSEVNKYDVRFTINGGLIDEIIFTNPNEAVHTLNLKRGILSSLQLPKNIGGTETTATINTVQGSCQTHIGGKADWEESPVSTKTDLTVCSATWRLDQALPFAKLNQASQAAVLQVIHPRNASRECSTTMDEEDHLSEVTCKEKFVFESLGLQSLPAFVSTRQTLKLKETRYLVSPASIDTTTSKVTKLTFELTKESEMKPVRLSEAIRILNDLVAATFPEVKESASTKFLEAVTLLRQASSNKLIQIQRRVIRCPAFNCDVTKQKVLEGLFQDALVACGTASCQKTVTKSLQDRTIPKDRAPGLLFALATSVDPDKAAITNTMNFCKSQLSSTCLLPLSIMVNKYQRSNDLNSEDNQSAIWKTVTMLKDVLGDDCRNTDANPAPSNSQLLVVLKGLANIGQEVIRAYDIKQRQVEDKVIPVVRQCVSNRAVHQTVAVQAVQTLESLDMSEEVQRPLVAILGFSEFPVELRSTIFDALLRHGTQETISDVIHSMLREVVTQMKAYMTSHISVIMQTSDTALLKLRDQLKIALLEHNQHTLLKPMVLSRQALSYYKLDTEEVTDVHIMQDTLHQHAETSVVYSPASVFPASSDIQISLQVLEQDIPVFNLRLDQEGLDQLGAGLVDDGDDDDDSAFAHLHSTILNQLEQLHDFVHHAHNNPQGVLHVRLFGYNIAMVTLDDLEFLSSLKGIKSQEDLWQVLRLHDQLRTLSDPISLSYSKAFVVPLVNEVIPTSVGLPLNLTLDGTAVFRVDAKGSWQGRNRPQTATDMNKFQISGAFSMSGSGHLETKLSVNLNEHVVTGLTHTTAWHASTNHPVTITSDSEGIKIRVNNLRRPEDIASHSSTTKTLGKQTNNVADNSQKRSPCLFAFVQRLTGWQLCAQHPDTKTDISLSATLHLMATFVWDSLPDPLTNLLDGLVTISGRSITINLPLPKAKGSESKPQGWFSYLQSAWSMMRSASGVNPPTYSAMVFSNSHMYTFDGQYYKHPGYNSESCAYVLCRDFVEGNFTILGTTKGIIVLTKDIAVTIDYQGQVKVNNSGESIDLPLQTWNGHVSIIQQGPNIILNTTYGLHVHCSANGKEYCIVSVDGNYHNKTLGLLGTNDNEISNDLRMRDGRIAHDLQDFINSYEVSGLPQCRPVTPNQSVTTQRTTICPTQGSATCLQMFDKQRSPLAPCFDKVDPKPFMTACEHETNQCGIQVKESLPCEMSGAYRALCLAKGVNVPQISQCSSCGNRPLATTWTETGSQMADIAIVTSLHQDMVSRTSLGDYMHQFTHSLKQQFRRQGIRDVKVALIGYGGQGFQSQAHQFTVNSANFGDISDQQWRHHFESLSTSGAQATSAAEALHLATSLPFRTNAARTVVILADNPQLSTEESANLDKPLESQDITLNAVSYFDSLKRNNRIGVQWNGHVVGERNVVDTRAFSQTPLAALARQTHGTIYDLNAISTRNTHKLHQVTKSIVRQLAEQINSCRHCVCAQTVFGTSVPQCTRITCS